MNLGLGQKLGGRYHILSQLGQGGFGATFLAEDRHLPGNHHCVVKQLKPQATDPQSLEIARRLFDTEAQVLHRLGKHEQIPQLFAYFEENKEFYLVQEYIEGHDLSQEITPGKQFRESEVISLLKDILEILEYVHAQNVIHRDINPQNIIRRKKDGKLVLIDFGAVKESSTQVAGGKTFTIAIGTPGYRPSEQANGYPKLSSDIYAVGMMGIQSLTGLTPQQILTDPDTGEINWKNQVPVNPELSKVLDKMVRYDFRERYLSAAQSLQALKDLDLTTQATLVPVSYPKSLRKSPKLSKLILAIGLVGIGLIATISITNTIRFSKATDSYNQGNTLYNLNRYKEALTAYHKAVELKPDYAEAWSRQGKTLLNLKRSQNALDAYDRAIQIRPEFTEAWQGRGYALDNLRRYEEAINSFNTAIKFQQNLPEAWRGKGNVLLDLQRYEEAIASYDKAIQYKSDDYESWYNRGFSFHYLKKYEDAIKSYDQALELKSNYTEAWYNRGNSLYELRRYEDAIASYDKTVQFQPNYYQAWYSRGNALINLRRYEDAIASYNQVIKLKSNDSKAWYNKAWCLQQLQRQEDALLAYNQAIKLNRSDYLAWYNRGNALYTLNRYREAIASYNTTLKLKPAHYESWYSRGNAYFKQKQLQEAIDSYNQALQYKQDYQQAIDARNQAQNQLDSGKEQTQ